MLISEGEDYYRYNTTTVYLENVTILIVDANRSPKLRSCHLSY